METGKKIKGVLQSFGTSLILICAMSVSAKTAEPLPLEGSSSLLGKVSQFCLVDSVSLLVSSQDLLCELPLSPQELSDIATEQQNRFEGLQQASEKLQNTAESNQIKFQKLQVNAEIQQEEHERQQSIAQLEQFYWEDRQFQAIAQGAIGESQVYYQRAQQALRESKSLLKQAEDKRLKAKSYQSHAENFRQEAQQHYVDARHFQRKAKASIDHVWYFDRLQDQLSEETAMPIMSAIEKKRHYEVLVRRMKSSIHSLSFRLLQADIALISDHISKRPTDISAKVVSLIMAEKNVRHQDIDLVRQKLEHWSEMAVIERKEIYRKNVFLILGLIVIPVFSSGLIGLALAAHLGEQLTNFSTYSQLDPIGRCIYSSLPEECRAELTVLCEQLKATGLDSLHLKRRIVRAVISSLFGTVRIYIDDQWDQLMVVLRLQ